jgi:hypothetical protein
LLTDFTDCTEWVGVKGCSQMIGLVWVGKFAHRFHRLHRMGGCGRLLTDYKDSKEWEGVEVCSQKTKIELM